MSGISAHGHNYRFVNFWHLCENSMSNLVGNSQLNKTVKPKNSPNHRISRFNNESQKGTGPKFNFNNEFSARSIPNSENEGKNEISPENNELPNKKIKVLIAEDDEVSSQLLAIVLKDISKEIIRARTGLEALKQCEIHKDIDLILMDIKMPEMNGLETTQKIREFNKDVYIIAQTAHALEGDREEALFAGCNDYISKPLDRVLLLEKIKKIL